MSAGRLGKIIRLLSSDKPGEVVASAAALKRSLQSHGLDIHGLAEIIDRHLDFPLAPEQALRGERPAPSPVRPAGSRLHIGDHVECRASVGVFRPCGCGSTAFTVSLGAGPHAAQLRCDACGCGGRFLARRLMGAPA